jgi:hypothetical protein
MKSNRVSPCIFSQVHRVIGPLQNVVFIVVGSVKNSSSDACGAVVRYVNIWTIHCVE